MFKRAIVRRPGQSIVNGLSSSNLGKPDYELACRQHQQYVEALKACGLEVTILDADDRYPDSTFVEDTALLTPNCAIITNPGAPSRRGETKEIATRLTEFYKDIEYIKPPGTVEGGDIMKVGSHYYIGISDRTNQEGATQLITILEKYELTGSRIPLKNVLHLKTGVAYIENHTLLATGEFVYKNEFSDFKILTVDEDEAYAANSIWVNDHVIMPLGYPKTKTAIEEAGYKVLAVDTSEFRKVDGGVSCLSLRF